MENNIFRISFPYLDRNNDHIELFIKINPDGTYLLTDDAETLNELELSGLDIFSSDRRVKILDTILHAHGVKMDASHALYIECDEQSLPSKKHMLTQCIIKVSDMFYLSRPNAQSFFIEDVIHFFAENEIYGFTDICFTGKSGLVTTYDFGIQRSKNAPERLVKIVNHLDNTKAGYITFLWGDTKEARQEDSSLYVFIQDEDKKIPQSAVKAMEQYEIRPVLWSQRDSIIGELTA